MIVVVIVVINVNVVVITATSAIFLLKSSRYIVTCSSRLLNAVPF